MVQDPLMTSSTELGVAKSVSGRFVTKRPSPMNSPTVKGFAPCQTKKEVVGQVPSVISMSQHEPELYGRMHFSFSYSFSSERGPVKKNTINITAHCGMSKVQSQLYHSPM